MAKRFKPQNLGCTCSWCRDTVDKNILTVHVSRYENHLFKEPMPLDWFQLCPVCEGKLTQLAIQISRESKN